jgi:hypothetical protein
MNHEAAMQMSVTVVVETVRHMAEKSGASFSEVLATIKADPRGATAEYFYSMLAAGTTGAMLGAGMIDGSNMAANIEANRVKLIAAATATGIR